MGSALSQDLAVCPAAKSVSTLCPQSRKCKGLKGEEEGIPEIGMR